MPSSPSKNLMYQENVHTFEMAVQQQYHVGVYYAWVKLRGSADEPDPLEVDQCRSTVHYMYMREYWVQMLRPPFLLAWIGLVRLCTTRTCASTRCRGLDACMASAMKLSNLPGREARTQNANSACCHDILKFRGCR